MVLVATVEYTGLAKRVDRSKRKCYRTITKMGSLKGEAMRLGLLWDIE